MDFDTLDATQAIYHDDFDDETDEDLSVSQRKPVGHLRVIEQKGLENKEYPVYEGDNVIGRHESCQICIPSKSLSKEHACITVKSHSHLIYDKGSRNKTKRGKLFLSPDVRYELKHKDELVFADVCCTYTIADEVWDIGQNPVRFRFPHGKNATGGSGKMFWQNLKKFPQHLQFDLQEAG